MTKKPEPFNNPFAKLKAAAEKKSEPQKPAPPVSRAQSKPKATISSDDEDAALFFEAVGEVNRVKKGAPLAKPAAPPKADAVRIERDEAESLTRLAESVLESSSFSIDDSPEGLDGALQNLEPRVRKKLKQGAFALDATLDLHGLTREPARAALERFIQDGRVAGHRCVLVIHGRGLNSVDAIPVLKLGVQEWLTRGRSARHVLAFCSATPADGGAGAVYVLLRR